MNNRQSIIPAPAGDSTQSQAPIPLASLLTNHMRPLTARLIHQCDDYLQLYHPYVKGIEFLNRYLDYDTRAPVGTSAVRAIHSSQHTLSQWRGGHVHQMYWQYQFKRTFIRLDALMRLVPWLESVGEQIISAMLLVDDVSDFHIDTILRLNNHSRCLALVMEDGRVRAAWLAAARQFRQDILQQHAQSTAPAAVVPNVAQLQDVHICLSQKEYRAAITAVVGSIKRRVDSTIPESCVICLEDMRERRTWHVLACGHSFHPHCLKNWLRKQCRQPICPLCRFDVRE